MLAVFFVLALSSSSATTELVIEDKFAEYSHDSPSFTVQYPKEWVKRSGEDSEVLFVSSGHVNGSLPAMTVTVCDVPPGFGLIDLPEETSNHLRRAMPWGIKFNGAITDIELDNGSWALAVVYFWVHKRTGIPFFATQVSAMKDNKLISSFAVDAKDPRNIRVLKQYTASLDLLVKESKESHSSKYEKDRFEVAAIPQVESKKKAGVKEMASPELNLSLPLSGLSSDDLKALEASLISRNGPARP